MAQKWFDNLVVGDWLRAVKGRRPMLATIIKVAGPQLTCQRQDDQSTLKTPLYGRDIVWRVPSLAA